MRSSFSHFMSNSQKHLSFLFLVGLFSQVIGVMQGSSSSILKAAKVARPNVTAFASWAAAWTPSCMCLPGSSHIRQAGLGFMANSLKEPTLSRPPPAAVAGSNAESSVFTKLSVKLSRKGDGVRAETPGGEDETMADVHNRDEMKTLNTLH